MTPEKWCDLARQIVFDIMDILHDDGTSFVVISNGLLLTKKMARSFNKYLCFRFKISIDWATAQLHDEFRGVEGSSARAVNGALEISDLRFRLSLRTPSRLRTRRNYFTY